MQRCPDRTCWLPQRLLVYHILANLRFRECLTEVGGSLVTIDVVLRHTQTVLHGHTADTTGLRGELFQITGDACTTVRDNPLESFPILAPLNGVNENPFLILPVVACLERPRQQEQRNTG